MAKVQKFEDLTIFQMARNLCKEVYAITKHSEFKNDSRFVQQIHAAAGSIMDNFTQGERRAELACAIPSQSKVSETNIAEGFEHDGNKEFVNFLYIAKGSCGEVRSQIIRATDVGFVDKDTATRLYNDCVSLSKALSKFIKSLRESGFSGLKFQEPRSKFQKGDADLNHET